jgi:SAM-dependent methyltransferase
VTGASDPEDLANGWDAIAEEFIARREHSRIGVATVRQWATSLPAGAAILDLGCGSGMPIAATLVEAGFEVWGVDASPRLAAEFRRRFPEARIACEAAEGSGFFDRQFDGVIVMGLLFLLPPVAQIQLLRGIPKAMRPGARLLFTAPTQAVTWQDILTGRESRSLGRQTYIALLSEAGLSLVGEYTDEGENHYYDFLRSPGLSDA